MADLFEIIINYAIPYIFKSYVQYHVDQTTNEHTENQTKHARLSGYNMYTRNLPRVFLLMIHHRRHKLAVKPSPEVNILFLHFMGPFEYELDV